VKRRFVLLGLGGLGAVALLLGRRLKNGLSRLTRSRAFTAMPPLVPHEPARDRTKLYVAQGGRPAENVDAVLAKLGGVGKVVGQDDVVLIKVSAQWWNQGMTNVAAVKRTIEQVLERPGFRGEVIVFENVHFRLPGGSGLARAWTHPSERNVDVPGWDKLGDLIPHFRRRAAPVSFVGLVDAGGSELAGDSWHDPGHTHGVYGGDERGPIAAGEDRDGYHWDLAEAFRLRRSLVDHAQTPLTWPVFTSPASGLVVDLRHGLFRREAGRRVPVARKLTWINMTTANAHGATGITAACKSLMGVVDMSAGRLGTHPLARDYHSVHYFGAPNASWRMAGPLAHFLLKVRKPDLYLTVADWVGVYAAGTPQDDDSRLSARCAFQTKTVVAGRDPVAIDAWCARNLLMPIASPLRGEYDLDHPDAKVVKFLRYFREVYGAGTLDPTLVEVS
jgi:hypothetical protein